MKMRFLNRWMALAGAAALLLVAPPPVLRAQEEPLPFPTPPAEGLPVTPDHSAGLLDPKAVMAAAAACTPEKYPDADDVQVDSHSVVYYTPAGTSVQWVDSFAKILTEKGRRDSQAWPFGFNVNYGGIQICKAEVYRADGTVVPVDLSANLKVQVDSSQMSANIYDPAQRMLALSFPKVDIGDTLRVVLRVWEHRCRVTDTFSDYTVFEGGSPIVREVYEVHAPAARPLRRIALKDEIPGTVKYVSRREKGVTIHRWEARDVPQFFPEPDMPAAYTCLQRLLISTAPDWNTISKWYWKLCEPRLDTVTPAMKAEVARLTKDCKTDREKVEVLFSFVSQQIRYMGITVETEAPGYEPHDVSLTFENRYGVCRDKAALLVAMLRLAGVEGFPVLIHSGPKKDPEVPMPAFNHAIVAARIKGEYILMDPTDETTRELLPAYLSGMSYLVATPRGDPLRTSPVPDATANLAVIRTEARLEAGGRLVARTRFEFDGINDNAYRGHFASRKPEERRRVFEGLIKNISATARLTSFRLEPEDMQDRTVPVCAEIGFEADDTLIAGADAALPPRLWFGDAIGVVHGMIESAALAQRRFPLRTVFPCGVRESFTLDARGVLDAPVALPAFFDEDSANLRWMRRLAVTNGVITGAAEFLLRRDEYSPAQYLELKKALSAIETDRRKTAVFRPAAAAAGTADADVPRPDAEMLEETDTYELQADGTWVVETRARKRILTYAGMKANSELKLQFNPATETPPVVEGRVTMASGETRAVTEKEINLMDARWNAAAPRYPGAKIMVVSLPGVEIGAEVEYRVRRTRRGLPFVSFEEAFGGFEPIARKTVRLITPADTALKLETTETARLPVKETRENGRLIREWTRENIPALQREGGLPPARLLLPAVAASTGDWAAYGRAVAAAFDAAAAVTPDLSAAARDAAGAAKGADAVRALRDFVARRIRPAGPSFTELPLDRLTPAATTLREGYGHNADRLILLAALLRATGFECAWHLASGDPDFAPVTRLPVAAPQYGYFEAPLLRVKTDSDPLWLDAGDQYAMPGTTPLEGRLALDCATGGAARLTVPAALAEQQETALSVVLDAQGHAQITRRTVFRGPPYGAMKKFYAELPPEERRRHHQELVSAISLNAVPTADLAAEFGAYPGVETLAVRVERFATRDGAFLHFTLPDLPDNVLRLGADRRFSPLYRAGEERSVLQYEVVLPEGFTPRITPPAELTRTVEGGTVSFRLAQETRDGRTVIRITRTMDLRPALTATDAYTALLKINGELSHPRHGTFLLEAAPAQPRP